MQEPWAHLLCPEGQIEAGCQELGPGVDTAGSHRARTALYNTFGLTKTGQGLVGTMP